MAHANGGPRLIRVASVITGAGLLLHALFGVPLITVFSIGGCGCLCPPVTNIVAGLGAILMLLTVVIALVFAADALSGSEAPSLEKLWSPALSASLGFLIAGGAAIGAALCLGAEVPPQAAVLVVGAALAGLAVPVGMRRARLGAAVGAVGALLIGVAGSFPSPETASLTYYTSWYTAVPAMLRASLIGHPLVMLSIAAVLALLAAGLLGRAVVAAAAAPLALLAFVSGLSLVGFIQYAAWSMSSPYSGVFTVVVSGLPLIGCGLVVAGAVLGLGAVASSLRGGAR